MRYTHTRLLVTQWQECYDFLAHTLGLRSRFGDAADAGYAEFEAGGDVVIAIFRKEWMSLAVQTSTLPVRTTDQDRVALCFDVPSVDASYADLSRKGVVFVTKPHDQPDWMIRVAHFRDPDGNLFEINTPLNVKPGSSGFPFSIA